MEIKIKYYNSYKNIFNHYDIKINISLTDKYIKYYYDEKN